MEQGAGDVHPRLRGGQREAQKSRSRRPKRCAMCSCRAALPLPPPTTACRVGRSRRRSRIPRRCGVISLSKHGVPAETYITGHSMGGHITMAIIERYSEAYQGAMPMCGPLGAAVDFLNAGVFDMLVTFEALFPGAIGSPYEPNAETVNKVKAAIAADPERAARYRPALRAHCRATARRAVSFPRGRR